MVTTLTESPLAWSHLSWDGVATYKDDGKKASSYFLLDSDNNYLLDADGYYLTVKG